MVRKLISSTVMTVPEFSFDGSSHPEYSFLVLRHMRTHADDSARLSYLVYMMNHFLELYEEQVLNYDLGDWNILDEVMHLSLVHALSGGRIVSTPSLTLLLW